ncbi:MAG TPA: DedA family protein [archaeon]|nr:DedA family protein [archaeon]
MVVEILFGVITEFIASMGYAGIFLLMALESMIAPVPSEAVMPFAGFLVAQGKFDFWLALIAASVGSIAGSALSYWIGKNGGKIFVRKIGKYFLLNEKHLEETEKFFSSHGGKAIFVSRFIPVVRHLISIPAGMGKMHFGKFIFLTSIGATAWNAILLYAGVLLGQNWELVAQNTKLIDAGVLVLLLVAVVWFVWRRIKK